MKKRIFLATLFCLSILGARPVLANDGFTLFLKDIEAEAITKGVPPVIVQNALASVAYESDVIRLDQKQPEKTISFQRYAKNILTPSMISRGAALLKEHRATLERLHVRYGLSPEIIVALWGIETSYGHNTGSFSVLSSLATLAYDGRRAAFFRNEFISALQILDSDHKSPDELRGSWAGAMGQCQFMPSTFLRFAIDEDGDGRRDIWNSQSDVFASMANYLSSEGWQPSQRWGEEVHLTPPLSSKLIGLSTPHKMSFWSQNGVTNVQNKPLSSNRLNAYLIQPDGVKGRSFLVRDNFRILMKWNRSTYFAVTIGLLSDQIRIKARAQ